MPSRTKKANYALNQLYKLMVTGVITRKIYNEARKMSKPKQEALLQRTQAKPKNVKPAQVSKIKRQIKEIKKTLDADNATHTTRTSVTGRVVSADSTVGYSQADAFTPALIEQSLIGLRYFDPSNPATLTDATGTTGTYLRQFGIHSMYAKLVVRNNYRVPAKVTIYTLKPKVDTGIAPQTAFTNGLADQNAPAGNSTMMFYTDSRQFNDLWIIEKSKSFELTPGHERTAVVSSKSFDYDPSVTDSHNLTYQRGFNTRVFVIRVEGVLTHDSTVTTEQGKAPAICDWSVETKIVVKYDAGINLDDYTINDGFDSFSSMEEVCVLHNTNQQMSLV